jgi:hypothetical protein
MVMRVVMMMRVVIVMIGGTHSNQVLFLLWCEEFVAALASFLLNALLIEIWI